MPVGFLGNSECYVIILLGSKANQHSTRKFLKRGSSPNKQLKHSDQHQIWHRCSRQAAFALCKIWRNLGKGFQDFVKGFFLSKTVLSLHVHKQETLNVSRFKIPHANNKMEWDLFPNKWEFIPK